MNRTCIILNPAARSEKAKRLKSQIESLAASLPEGASIKYTEGPGDAEAKAERAVEQGYRTIVAAGGDGTINEVVNGLTGFAEEGDEPPEVTLGILPIGTVNVFSMELGIPSQLEKAWEIIVRGKTRLIDLARANDHRFVQLAGVGFDAQIVARTEWESKKRLGPLSYVLTGAQIVTEKPPKLVVRTAEGKTYKGCFVLIGNGRFYGGPFSICKEAKLDDGLLDVCIFEQMNPLALVWYLQGILTGKHTSFPDVRYFKSRSLRVESDEKVPVEVDGELLGFLPCEFSVSPRSLRVLAPEARAKH
ncbi:MAG TPA: diacylglycerol kinase family protein [Candidatus Methylacidiphilales bacterium]